MQDGSRSEMRRKLKPQTGRMMEKGPATATADASGLHGVWSHISALRVDAADVQFSSLFGVFSCLVERKELLGHLEGFGPPKTIRYGRAYL